jgi:AcrR family transcriptional regulator
VARTAGLSHGLVNFHFESKARLLSETLHFLAEEYRQNWVRYLEAAPDAPAAQLDALLRADLDPAICTPSRLSAWLAFWGEAQGRPLYQERASANDAHYIARMEDICARLMAEGGYQGDVRRIARVLRITTEGVWLDMMTMTGHDIHLCGGVLSASLRGGGPACATLTCGRCPVHHGQGEAGTWQSRTR